MLQNLFFLLSLSVVKNKAEIFSISDDPFIWYMYLR